MQSTGPFLKVICLLALAQLSCAQTVRTSVICLSDGQCITETGDEAVCGKIKKTGSADLPTVKGKGDRYVITINLKKQLPQDPVEFVNDPECDPLEEDCSVEPTSPEEEAETVVSPEVTDEEELAGVSPEPLVEKQPMNDPKRNPFLGWVGCVTRAFPKACQFCCFQTAILAPKGDQCFGDVEIEKGEDDEGASDERPLKLVTKKTKAACSKTDTLGFRRSPSKAFFGLCRRRAKKLCRPGFRKCRDFRF